ncbi:hypothetical protein AB0N16_20045 [Streptomyces sp. NPDC051105]|uniref:hypothetical protein n=1 Tax=Streptomyces sp. NPDC051105 TaxID=3154843 RepID=UPI00341ED0B3
MIPSKRTVLGWLLAAAVVVGGTAWYARTQINTDPAPVSQKAEVEVTQYDTETRHGQLTAIAEYVVHNTGHAPATYVISFDFGGPDKTVRQHVLPGGTYTGTTTVPWDKQDAFTGVRVRDVQKVLDGS